YQKLIKEINTTMGFPVDYLVAGLFTSTATAIGNKIRLFHMDNWVELSSLYSIIVGKPGDGKTPALNYMMKPIDDIDKELYMEYKQNMKHYEVQLEQGGELTKPSLTQYLIDDSTIESVVQTLSTNEKGL